MKVKAASPCLCNLNTNVFNQYIAAYFHDQPGKLHFSTRFSISLLVLFVKMLYFAMHTNRSVVLRRFNGGVFDVTGYIDQIHIGNGASVTNTELVTCSTDQIMPTITALI